MNLTCQELCDPSHIMISFQGCLASNLFVFPLTPVLLFYYRFRTCNCSCPFGCKFAESIVFAGFYVLYLFHFSIDRVDTYLKGNGGHVRVSVDGQTLATDQPIRRAGVSNCTIIFCHDLEEAFI